jgi:hypothetical protein
VAVELRGDDVVLATVAWWRGKARVELPTVRPKAAADGGCRRRSSSCNWRATSGRGAPVSYGEACTRVDGAWRGSGAGCPRACRAWPEQEKTAAVKCGSSARNWALELAEQGVGVEVILLRVRDRKIRPCGECSTATRRWRPAEALGRRGTCARGQEGRGTAAGKARGDAWVLAEAGGGT